MAGRIVLQVTATSSIKAFYGTSERKRRQSQVWIAVSIYVLVAIVEKTAHSDLSLYTILQILSLTLFEKGRFTGLSRLTSTA